MTILCHLAQGLRSQCTSQPVVKGLGQVNAGLGHNRELADRNDRVAGAHAHFADLVLGAGADVDVHILLLDYLLPLFPFEQVGRFGAQDTDHVPFGCADQHPVAQQYLVPPSTQGLEFDKALLGDQPHHETDLVHVAGQHYPWLLVVAHMLADEGSHLVLLDDGNVLEVLAHDRAYLVLVARDASYFRDLFQKSLGLVHDLLLVVACHSRFLCGRSIIPQLASFV